MDYVPHAKRSSIFIFNLLVIQPIYQNGEAFASSEESRILQVSIVVSSKCFAKNVEYLGVGRAEEFPNHNTDFNDCLWLTWDISK